MRRNQYEESLFKCEDDRLEMDTLLESFRSFASRAEEVLYNMRRDLVSRVGPFRIEDHFTAIDVRCIERLYGAVGPEMISSLRERPYRGLLIILTRIRQKLNRWTDSRSGFAYVWVDRCAKIHSKLSERGKGETSSHGMAQLC